MPDSPERLSSEPDLVTIRMRGRGWEGFTGNFGLFEFVAGMAVVSRLNAQYLARLVPIEEVGCDLPLGPGTGSSTLPNPRKQAGAR